MIDEEKFDPVARHGSRWRRALARTRGGRQVKKLGMIVTQFLLLGCVAQDDARLKKVAELDTSLASLQLQVKAAEDRIQSLQVDVWTLQAQAEPYKSATFDPGSPRGYGRIDTTGGTFLVSIQNVTPYLDGFRVSCNFGNPSSATFHGFKLKAKWGPRSPLGQKDAKITHVQWQAALREKELSLTETLQAASWNPLSFVLSPAKADEFGYLELSMETDNLSLRK